jgi:UDP-GlcNAc:undecaprenyl-phosphate GlcNAc-1-phosphate transferase
MKSFLLSGFMAFCAACAVMPFAGKLSRRLGAVSETGGRHVGVVPVGRLGGGGALFAVFLAVFLHIIIDPSIRVAFQEQQQQILGLIIGVILVATIGIWDDIRRVKALLKLSIQIISAIVAYAFGLRITGVDLPLLDPIDLGWLSLPATVVWIVGVVNAVNLIDGLDGLAGGVILFSCLVNLVAAIKLGAIVPVVLMISVFGAILGFLLYNWYPAKIFLGDGGAYSMGFILAITGLLNPVQKSSTGIGLLIPILSLGLPIFDMLLTMFRRAVNRRGIFSPDRGHVHHILLDSGISHQRVVLCLYLVCCALCSVALATMLSRDKIIGLVIIAFSVVCFTFWSSLFMKQSRQSVLRFKSVFHQSGSGKNDKKAGPKI